MESSLSVKFYYNLPPDNRYSRLIINDSPRILWRGNARLFTALHAKEFITKYIDYWILTTDYIPWHLVDDQGWRIEIKAISKLTELGAWRDSTWAGLY
jgi:hexosaminidase